MKIKHIGEGCDWASRKYKQNMYHKSDTSVEKVNGFLANAECWVYIRD